MTKQEVDKCIVELLRMEAGPYLNQMLKDEQFLVEFWVYQKSGAILNENTILSEAINHIKKKVGYYN
jgi:hypothetical protein